MPPRATKPRLRSEGALIGHFATPENPSTQLLQRNRASPSYQMRRQTGTVGPRPIAPDAESASVWLGRPDRKERVTGCHLGLYGLVHPQRELSARNSNAATQPNERQFVSRHHFEELRPSDSEQSRRLDRSEQQRLVRRRRVGHWAQRGAPGTRVRLVPGPSASPEKRALLLVGLWLIVPTPVPFPSVVALQGALVRCDAGSDGRLGVVDYRVRPTSGPEILSQFAIDLSERAGAG
jgi:hypothetical protein